jgi:hypothetical protein
MGYLGWKYIIWQPCCPHKLSTGTAIREQVSVSENNLNYFLFLSLKICRPGLGQLINQLRMHLKAKTVSDNLRQDLKYRSSWTVGFIGRVARWYIFKPKIHRDSGNCLEMKDVVKFYGYSVYIFYCRFV